MYVFHLNTPLVVRSEYCSTWSPCHSRRAVRAVEAHSGAAGRQVPAAPASDHVHGAGFVATAVVASQAHRARIRPRIGLHTDSARYRHHRRLHAVASAGAGGAAWPRARTRVLSDVLYV